MGGNAAMICSSRWDQKVMPIRPSVESEPDERILNHIGVMEPSRMCFDQLLMRAAAAAAEADYRVQRRGCWEGNPDEADLRQTDKQGLQGKHCAAVLKVSGWNSPTVRGDVWPA